MITITNKKTGEKLEISRDVRIEHPDWVHQQLGTDSEGALQAHLDQCQPNDWYCDNGTYLGPDCCGLEITKD